MKKLLKTGLSALCGLTLLAGAALADTISITGTVTAGTTTEVYAPIGGTVDTVNVEVGQEVKADDVLYSLKTTKVYAAQDGTVTGVFGQPGDSAETIGTRYGAVLYLEGTAVYSVEASTTNAFNSTETKFVHVGETVYIQCKSNTARSGVGVITSIDGTSYKVEVESGTFIPGDTVELFRDSAYSANQKVGRGTVSRISPTAVTATGAIVRVAVENGDQVKRGDLLIETLTGTFDGYYMAGTDVQAGTDGIVGSISATQGANVQKDSVVAVIYDTSTMRVEAKVSEDSRGDIHVGDPVLIELEADESHTYQGVVTLVSAVAEASSASAGTTSSSDGVNYKVLVDFTPDEAVRFGMSVVVTTEEAEAAEPAEADETPETEESNEEVENSAE